MNKIAVFGKPGGGKSTLSNKLSVETGLPYYPLDLIQYEVDGTPVSRDIYIEKHYALISQEKWIIDGLGNLESFWARLDAADTLIYIDLPYPVHYWWGIKRLLKSVLVKPEGWPEGSSVIKGTINTWKYLRLSPKFWTIELLAEIEKRNSDKDLYRINSVHELNNFKL